VNRSLLPQVLVSVAQNRTLSEVLYAIVSGITACHDVVLARIWLIGPGDVCGTCSFRPECPSQEQCLHLVASAGSGADSGPQSLRPDSAFRRFPLGVRKIGRVGKSGEALLIEGVHGDEDWVARPSWMKEMKVRTFAAQPLVFRGQVLGVLAIFDRGALSKEDFDWLRVVADHAAVSIANARAFEEIESLKARLEEENRYLREEVTSALGVGDIVGGSAGLKKVMEQIQLVAPTNATVLITGESGTGKELVARAIHENSGRRDRPFVKVNCGAITESLFESEFFGHVKGAFTGALRDKPGRFELANGGTLLLDEIGEVPLGTQAKLLRVLQEQEIERVGDTRVRKIDVRIIAATNRNLKAESAQGKFREDLYYRLSVFPIDIPALRDRHEDIVPLAVHFAAQAARRMNRPVPRLTATTAAMLARHEWPGNVRELQHAIERAVIVSTHGTLKFDFLGASEIKERESTTRAPEGAVLTRDGLRQAERESITRALSESRGKIFGPDGAAERLGMRPTTLASRIKALGIPRSRS